MPAARDRKADRGDELTEATSRGLRYVGQGAAVPDVPARDLTADEALLYGRNELLATGLYAEPESEG